LSTWYSVWESPTPSEVADELFASAERLMHVEYFLEAAKAHAMHDMSERFLTETDPDGQAWREWSDSYAQTAEANNIGILRRADQDLYMSAMDESAWEVTPEGLFFDTSGLPDYWEYHQDGTFKMEARPFIGLSDDAERAIDAEFFAWVEGAVRIHAPAGRFMSAGPL
jgi:hypothetical protein